MSNPRGRVTHGKSGTRTYRIWCGMKNRCLNPNNKRYSAYGGRGITLDPKWHSYEGFLDDMGEAPDGQSLDRINNDGAYTKANCRWATNHQQARNSKRAVWYEGKHVTQWAEELGVTPATVHYRVKKFGSPHYPDNARNKLEIDGVPVSELAKQLGVPYQTARMHYYMHGNLDRLKEKG